MSSNYKPTNIHLWLPNLFEFKGGIQVFSAFLLEVLGNIYSETNYNVFLKHDTKVVGEYQFSNRTKFHFSGKWHHKIRTPAFAAQLISSGIRLRPDLIITSHLNFTEAAYCLKKLTGIPYWTIAHGVEAWNIKRPSLQTALRYADRILAVSSYTRDRLLQEQNLDPKKVVILPNTFNSERFQIADKPINLLKKYQLKPQQPVILTVNRLVSSEPYRGYDKILEALPIIRQVIPNIHYIIVGKGDDRSRLERSINQRNLQDCVTLAGFVPDSELSDYYNLCDVFAMPSKLEGFGIVYLEALASGKPVLGGNQDGAIDALCRGELGVLINPDDELEIAQSIIQILQGTYPNPLIYQPQGLRQKVIDYFGFERFEATLTEYLKQYL